MIREDEDDRKAKKGAKKTFSKADLPGVMLGEIQKGRKEHFPFPSEPKIQCGREMTAVQYSICTK